MAATTIGNYDVIAKLVEGYVSANFTHDASLLSSGLVGTIPTENLSEGNTWQIRGDIQYHTAWQTPTAATDLTLRAISHYKDIGVILRRADSFGFEDAARIAAGDTNALQRIGAIITDQIAYNLEDSFLQDLIPGVFNTGGPLDSDTYMVTESESFKPEFIASARKLHGARGARLNRILMHPDVYYNAQIDKLATGLDYDTITRFNQTGMTYGGMYGGAMILLNDRVYNSSGTYHTYLLRPGALALGYQKNLNMEADRDKLLAAGTDFVKYDMYYSPHIFGLTFSGSASTTIGGTTDAVLGTGSNWSTRTSVNASEIGIVAIETTEA